MSKVYSLKRVQLLPVSIEQAWDFFSKPANLKDITPGQMGFVVKNNDPDRVMYAGQIIEYTVRPLFGIPVYWMTEITHVEHHRYFVDEQRFGPYALWHHQHHFRQIPGGVEMTDLVHYKIPYFFLGSIANRLLVKRQLDKIFDFRERVVEKKFGKMQ